MLKGSRGSGTLVPRMSWQLNSALSLPPVSHEGRDTAQEWNALDTDDYLSNAPSSSSEQRLAQWPRLPFPLPLFRGP